MSSKLSVGENLGHDNVCGCPTGNFGHDRIVWIPALVTFRLLGYPRTVRKAARSGTAPYNLVTRCSSRITVFAIYHSPSTINYYSHEPRAFFLSPIASGPSPNVLNPLKLNYLKLKTFLKTRCPYLTASNILILREPSAIN